MTRVGATRQTFSSIVLHGFVSPGFRCCLLPMIGVRLGDSNLSRD